ncbi:hypothetical protein HN51_045921 [Arachis hypogaea]|uniref:uncharacterized protein LOC107614392 n=1 Tax=Arachis ipaensis TaxID=130454 RepID=UPI0007AF52F3|nr:uncharacterized protein LOC107614392 [Arachis ipaensis]XP_025670723.1 uncharacterized protein LOC112770607 [Arachis hypogaea]QHN98169.1 uncharacterized protein DS421_18g633730 [Arachis hypogaea]
MEGLVPLVLRALKKNRNRRQYECLDSSSLSYNITMAEIYHHHHHAQSDVDHHHHRRHKSVEDFGNGVVGSSSISSPPPISKQQQLMRFRSQRMFSCITGS